ncbi:endonuclease-reverse transcriptase-domain-containing protein [Gilbertella persicaria]|uniref:endonuclease-reverse transcriptase-domain-containing protein n=1 Tax=Gilbertella persicaria TaxID=101096 RepID=UPI00221F5B99|nr:endonuclease-reverse transcriptase-domain-containing protein [Gilbertella persicaria]KAI8084266.1 endonuclease-reverse transcriptase-domain-containing protein [Gilbertella persicaria]
MPNTGPDNNTGPVSALSVYETDAVEREYDLGRKRSICPHCNTKELDINNNKHVLAVLIHNDYAEELRLHLAKFKINLKNDFNPCSPNIHRDPKYANDTPTQRAAMAHNYHCERMVRALDFIREPVKFAVARYLHRQGWIDSTLLEETLRSSRSTSKHAADLFGRDDDMLTDGQQGISLLVPPSCLYTIHHIQYEPSSTSQYKLSFVIADILVHCLYIPPHESREKVQAILDSLSLSWRNTTQTIICGDFNARMGSFTGDKINKPHRLIVKEWIQGNNLIVWNSWLQLGNPTCLRQSGSSIVDYFLSTNELLNPKLTICEDMSLDSDHKLMHLDFLTNSAPPPPSENPRII